MKLIAEKIRCIMKDVGYLQKDSRHGQGYNYVSESAAITAIREAMIKHHVVAIPHVDSFLAEPAGATKSGTSQYMTTMKVSYTLIDTDSGESLQACSLGQGLDVGDKGAYKAATGANKYFLMKTFQLATGDDPEADHGEPNTAAEPAPAVNRGEIMTRIKNAEEKLKEIGAFKNASHTTNARKKILDSVSVTDNVPTEKLELYLTDLAVRYKEHKKETKDVS